MRQKAPILGKGAQGEHRGFEMENPHSRRACLKLLRDGTIAMLSGPHFASEKCSTAAYGSFGIAA
jgi:hypothetical protein